MQELDVTIAMAPVVTELVRLGARYYVGGSVASSAYGYSRSTVDADLVADLAPPHATPLFEALQSDYYISLPAVTQAIAERSSFNVIHLATSFKVDVFVLKARQYDRIVLNRAHEDSLDEERPSERFLIASPEDVVLAKLEWFRLGEETSQQQWRDVLGVLKVQAGALDVPYMRRWASELGVADLLEKALDQAAE